MKITPFKIASGKPGTENRKAYAARLLNEFRWKPEQKELLQKMAENGYWIGTVNDAERVFNLPITKDGEKRCVLVYGYYSDKLDLIIENGAQKFYKKYDISECQNIEY